MSMQFEKVAGPYQGMTGGLAWDGAGMLFSAVDEQRILRFDPTTGETAEWRRHTQRTNGIALGPDGIVYGAQEAARRIIKFMPDGSGRQTAFKLDGAFHNQPSDLCVDRKGRIWFTDPHHEKGPPGPHIFDLLDHQSVLRLDRTPQREWAVRRASYDTQAPRALRLSRDGATLYLAEGDTRTATRELRAYPVADDGSLGAFTVLHTFGADHRGPHRGIEGLCLDAAGNIVACGGWKRSGPGPLVTVFAPSGAVLETHALPCDMPMRIAFGDADLTSLYVTSADGCLYRAKGTGRSGAAS